MVLDVCRQLLGDRHHAEDAFQAVFLVLARKARSIRDPDLLGNWLYGVALRTARKARGTARSPRKNEEGGAMRHPVRVQASGRTDGSIGRAAGPGPRAGRGPPREIDRLPGPFRLPVVLCYFEGLTLDEAARRLRWPGRHGPQPTGPGARQAPPRPDPPRRGLARAGLAAALSSRSASASVSSPLCDITTRAAMNFAAGQAAAALRRRPLPRRCSEIHADPQAEIHRVTLLVLGAVATGAGYLTHSLAMKDEPKTAGHRPRPQLAAKPDDADPSRPRAGCSSSAACSIPQGKPVPDAMMMVYAAIKQPGGGIGLRVR